MARSDDGDPQNKNRKRNSSGAEDSSSNSNHPAKKLNTGNDVKKRPVGRPPLNKTKGSGASGEENSKAGLNTENLGHSNSTDKNNQPPSLIKPTKQECIPVEEVTYGTNPVLFNTKITHFGCTVSSRGQDIMESVELSVITGILKKKTEILLPI
ncbi:hypothetical protein TWF706_001253 [Orbilia oligospora]|nr:hypothetical protein TWF706_001253 [Orbilia oligospora]